MPAGTKPPRRVPPEFSPGWANSLGVTGSSAETPPVPRSLRTSTLTSAVIAAALALLVSVGLVPLAATTSGAATTRRGPVVGGDVSWPQCPVGLGIPSRRSLGLPMPSGRAQFVVIGLTNGPAFTPNPCLGTQVDWARERDLPVAAYAVATWPTARQLAGHGQRGPYAGRTLRSKLRNVGYQEGRYNLRRLASAGLTVPHVWIDVEHYSIRPWSKDRLANRALVRGIVRAYQDAGVSPGFYSTTLQWPDILGSPRWGLPEWHTAGPRSRAVALSRCTEPSFQGGPVVLAQWWTDTVDRDLVCPTGPAGAAATALDGLTAPADGSPRFFAAP